MTAAQSNYQRCCTPIVLAMVALATIAQPSQSAAQSLHPVIDRVQPKIVKIYGAGGLRGLEAYQSGFLFSAEGHILSVFSYVLDSQVITVVLDDGRKYEPQMLGAALLLAGRGAGRSRKPRHRLQQLVRRGDRR